MASKGLIEVAAPEFTANESVWYAGVLLALPFLTDLNDLETIKKCVVHLNTDTMACRPSFWYYHSWCCFG
jgi:hypothetical protein